jgi:hypothetical protein
MIRPVLRFMGCDRSRDRPIAPTAFRSGEHIGYGRRSIPQPPTKPAGLGLDDQPTKLAAVSTIPMNNAPTQDNRISSLRIDLIFWLPVRAPQPRTASHARTVAKK